MKPIAFVIPWYGEDIPGGAEAECRSLVYHLNKAGIKVEVLTTCVKEFLSDWNSNYYQEGTYQSNGITVRRFSVRQRDVKAFDKVNYKLINNIPILNEEEKIFFDEMIYSTALNEYIDKNKDNYHCFVLMPYMFGTTYWGVKSCKGKCVLLPCLHDEAYAHMKLVKEMVEDADGIIYNSRPEFELSNELYNLGNSKQVVLGMGIDIEYFNNADSYRFRKKYNIWEDFILYAGRKDKGKNVDQLINFFIQYKTKYSSKVKLVLIGGGQIEIPTNFKTEIIDLGFVSAEDKYDAYCAASIFCNPSMNESFSIVIMEGWLGSTPVLVNETCKVTKNFCIESKGGLYYHTLQEFCDILNILLTDEKLSKVMGDNGRNFVVNNFSWDIVTRKYIDFFNKIGDLGAAN